MFVPALQNWLSQGVWICLFFTLFAEYPSSTSSLRKSNLSFGPIIFCHPPPSHTHTRTLLRTFYLLWTSIILCACISSKHQYVSILRRGRWMSESALSPGELKYFCFLTYFWISGYNYKALGEKDWRFFVTEKSWVCVCVFHAFINETKYFAFDFSIIL